ncbi:MAG: NRDE family protein [Gammaproteobacteria bacterium]|jgi:uncharacterized protein with NRDE domain|nr:NRDE family protein [Gammaproteobacteria bacterium]
MCLILIAYRCYPGIALLVAANRDEFHDRPTAPLAFWDDAPQVLAGRDLQHGGTWLGVTQSGRFAALTNYRDPRQVRPDAPSRGQLVSAYLQGAEPALDYLARLATQSSAYNGFNLLLGDAAGLHYYSNRGAAPQTLSPGWYGLSNHLLNTPWPKLQRGLALAQDVLARQPDPVPDDWLQALADRVPVPDADLPNTGVPLEWERWLSPIFIDAPGYGTRSSTVLLAKESGPASLVETTWGDGGRCEFTLNGWTKPGGGDWP